MDTTTEAILDSAHYVFFYLLNSILFGPKSAKIPTTANTSLTH